MKMEPLQSIKKEGEFLGLDQTKTITCPYCASDWRQQGKPSAWRPERSMSITRNYSGYLYICFRASCSKQGIVGSPMRRLTATTKNTRFVPRLNDRPLVNVPNEVLAAMLKPYNIDAKDCIRQHFKWDNIAQRLYMPVYNRMGYCIGTVGKALARTTKPKAVLYRHKDVPMLHYPLRQPLSQPLVLVEDIISSVKVAKIVPCAALLGSNITRPILNQLLSNKERDIILLLDGDASEKALYLAKKYSSLFGTFRLVRLSKEDDPKNLALSELRRIL